MITNIEQMVYNKDIPILQNKYPVTWLVSPDWHLLNADPNNRTHLRDKGLQLLDELLYISKQNRFTGHIQLGDFADRGFNTDLSYITKVLNVAKEYHDYFGDNNIMMFGNHELTYYKDNIYYAITDIQSDVIKQQIKNLNIPKNVYSFFKAPSMLDYDALKIYLFHYDKYNKNYKVLQNHPQCVCLYHDDLITFESQQELYHHRLGNGINVTNTDIFNNVDWAICGHIHTPLETFQLNNLRKTMMDVPGSCMQRTIAERHSQVKLPVIGIDQKGFHIEYITFKIGEIEETEIKEIIVEQKKKTEMMKVIKQKNADFQWASYEEFLQNISNPLVRKYIVDSDNQLVIPSSAQLSKKLNKIVESNSSTELNSQHIDEN